MKILLTLLLLAAVPLSAATLPDSGVTVPLKMIGGKPAVSSW